VRSPASLNSASAPRRELFLPSHLALRHHRGSMLNFLALPQCRQLVLQARRSLINNLARRLIGIFHSTSIQEERLNRFGH
jgi:hypothetical protein